MSAQKIHPHTERAVPRTPDAARLKAFTLVELLVVIGIIALLISILLPALNKARRAAQTTTCMSNLRQIGIAYRFYAEANNGYMPYILNNSWNSYIPGSGNQKRLYWYMALAPFLTKGYDPMSLGNNTQSMSKVFRACPSWNQWIDPDAADAEWIVGYGQNLYMYAGYYTKAGRTPGGSNLPVITNTAPETNINYGIDGQSEGVPNSYCAGQLKLAKITKPAMRIICGDAVQYWMGLGFDSRGAGGIPNDIRFDFNRSNQSSGGDSTSANAVAMYVLTNWRGGHPNRHGGEFSDCAFNGQGAKVSVPKANYLFADGHVLTLSYIEARRAMQVQP